MVFHKQVRYPWKFIRAIQQNVNFSSLDIHLQEINWLLQKRT